MTGKEAVSLYIELLRSSALSDKSIDARISSAEKLLLMSRELKRAPEAELMRRTALNSFESIALDENTDTAHRLIACEAIIAATAEPAPVDPKTKIVIDKKP